MELTSVDVGTKIRETRKSMGLRQREVALAAGTGLRFIIELERGKETCQLGKMLRVARVLGLKLTLESTSEYLEGEV